MLCSQLYSLCFQPTCWPRHRPVLAPFGDVFWHESRNSNYRINYIITRHRFAARQAREKQMRWVRRTGMVLGTSGWADSVSLRLAHLSSSGNSSAEGCWKWLLNKLTSDYSSWMHRLFSGSIMRLPQKRLLSLLRAALLKAPVLFILVWLYFFQFFFLFFSRPLAAVSRNCRKTGPDHYIFQSDLNHEVEKTFFFSFFWQIEQH